MSAVRHSRCMARSRGIILSGVDRREHMTDGIQQQNSVSAVRTADCTCLWKRSQRKDLFVSNHPRIREILANLDLIARSDASVLITGESGTGKEVIAQYIHQKSGKKDKPWVAINCAALPRDVIENELFGHEREAYTGAFSKRLGCFELANEGTLFLDEIAEMHPQVQAKLLRAIELKSFRRIGGSEETEVNVRIVAATNRDIQEALKAGDLREDLYYRLSVVEIALPPLRERRSDIPLLAAYFACQLCEKYGKRCKGFSPDALDNLAGYRWPGNVRELRNTIESLVLICPDDNIGSQYLPSRIAGLTEAEGPALGIPVGASLAEVERLVIEKTLEAQNNNKSETARVLGVSRKYLYSKLDEYRRHPR